MSNIPAVKFLRTVVLRTFFTFSQKPVPGTPGRVPGTGKDAD